MLRFLSTAILVAAFATILTPIAEARYSYYEGPLVYRPGIIDPPHPWDIRTVQYREAKKHYERLNRNFYQTFDYEVAPSYAKYSQLHPVHRELYGESYAPGYEWNYGVPSRATFIRPSYIGVPQRTLQGDISTRCSNYSYIRNSQWEPVYGEECYR